MAQDEYQTVGDAALRVVAFTGWTGDDFSSYPTLEIDDIAISPLFLYLFAGHDLDRDGRLDIVVVAFKDIDRYFTYTLLATDPPG